jgi:hypothetical protein
MGVVSSHTVRAFIERVFRKPGLLGPKVQAHLQSLGINSDAPRDGSPETWWKVVR